MARGEKKKHSYLAAMTRRGSQDDVQRQNTAPAVKHGGSRIMLWHWCSGQIVPSSPQINS